MQGRVRTPQAEGQEGASQAPEEPGRNRNHKMAWSPRRGGASHASHNAMRRPLPAMGNQGVVGDCGRKRAEPLSKSTSCISGALSLALETSL